MVEMGQLLKYSSELPPTLWVSSFGGGFRLLEKEVSGKVMVFALGPSLTNILCHL